MIMTHYMELLAANAPWNLILFMVIPMGVGEFLVATEFFTLFYSNKTETSWRVWNKGLSIFLSIYYFIITVFLLVHIIPSITTWRTWIDTTAIYAYVIAAIPMIGIGLLEFNLLGRNKDAREKMKLHATLLVIYLILGHIAMIFGMTSPALAGYTPSAQEMQMNMNNNDNMNMQQMPMNGQNMPMQHQQMMNGQNMPMQHQQMMNGQNMQQNQMNGNMPKNNNGNMPANNNMPMNNNNNMNNNQTMNQSQK